jgi:hypothetical protein
MKMLALLETNSKYVIGQFKICNWRYIYLRPKFFTFFPVAFVFTKNAPHLEMVMKYSPRAAAGYTSLGDGGRAMEHEIRDLVMPDLRRCGGESDGRI